LIEDTAFTCYELSSFEPRAERRNLTDGLESHSGLVLQ